METKVTQLASLLQSCIDKKAHLAGKLLHAQILRLGLFSHVFLSNRLVDFYSKCGNFNYASLLFDRMPGKNVYSWNAMLGAHCKYGNLEDAQILFVKMPERNTVSWNTMISALVRGGSEGKALNIYYLMNREGFVPSNFTLASVLSACGTLIDLEHGRRCHGLAVKIGLDGESYVENALVGMYAKCKSITDAIQALGDMLHPNEVSFTAMMSGLAQSDHIIEALELFGKMCRIGIHIDSVSLSSVLGVCAKGGAEESGIPDQNHGASCDLFGKQVHVLIIKLGFETDLHVANSLLDMYAKNGNMDIAEMLFANLPEVSVVSWNVMIAGYGQKCQCKKAIELLQRMKLCNFEPDEVTYVSLFGACVRSGDIETGRQMFERISMPNVTSWNAILSGYTQNGNHGEAVELFRKMQFLGIQPDRTTMAVVLSSCAGMGSLESGKQVHAASLKFDIDNDIFVASGLVDMYSKCGNLDLARRIFERIPEMDVVCWNSMVAGFAVHSLDKEAFALFNCMQAEGMAPTQFSFTIVLNSCSRLASLSQGRQVHAQVAKHGYIDDVFVGSAVIDMYSKCGDVNGAHQFFDKMPYKNVVTWNEMIHGSAQNGHGEEAVCLYEDMIRSGVEPDGITFVAVLTACSHAGLVDAGLRIFNSMQQDHGIEPLADHYTCIVDSLGRAGRFDEAEVIINEMPCKDDPIIWEVLLSSCRVHANANLGQRAAEEMFRLDPENPAPYVLLFNIYAALGRWDDAWAVRGRMSDRQVVKDPGRSWIEFKNGMPASMMKDDIRTLPDETGAVNDSRHLSLGVVKNVSRTETCSS